MKKVGIAASDSSDEKAVAFLQGGFESQARKAANEDVISVAAKAKREPFRGEFS